MSLITKIKSWVSGGSVDSITTSDNSYIITAGSATYTTAGSMLPYRIPYDPGPYYGLPRYHDCHDEFHKDCGGVSYACVFCLLDIEAERVDNSYTISTGGNFNHSAVLTALLNSGMLTTSQARNLLNVKENK